MLLWLFACGGVCLFLCVGANARVIIPLDLTHTHGPQDCAQSMESTPGCRWVTPTMRGLCYTNVGQLWCEDNPGSPDCVDLGDKADANWEPVQAVPFTGTHKESDDTKAPTTPTFSCTCAKRCSYWRSQNKLRCADGWELVCPRPLTPLSRQFFVCVAA